MSEAIIVAIITGGLSLIGVIVSGRTTISPSASRCLKNR